MSSSLLGEKEQDSIKQDHTVIRSSGYKPSFCPHTLHIMLSIDELNPVPVRWFNADKVKSDFSAVILNFYWGLR